MSEGTPGRKRRVSDDELLAVFEDAADPALTATEVADTDHITIKRRAVYDRLETLHEEGRLEKKQVGGRTTIWWLADGPASDSPDYLKSFGKYEGTNIAESVAAVSDRLDADLRERQERQDALSRQ